MFTHKRCKENQNTFHVP